MQAAVGDDRAGFNELSPKNKFLYLCSGGVVWVICTGCVDFFQCKRADESPGVVGGGDYAG